MADNKVAILPLIFSPSGVSHQNSDKFVRVQNSLIVAMSPDFDCTADNVSVLLHAGLHVFMRE